MMTKDDKEIKLAIFPNTIKYKRVKDGNAMSTTGVTLQVVKTEGITATEFRANMAENGSNLMLKQVDPSSVRNSFRLAKRATWVITL
jgi:hypothetical protein